jgi:putative transposase
VGWWESHAGSTDIRAAAIRRMSCANASASWPVPGPRYGYRRLTVMLRREEWKVNTKRVYRIYREENLGVRTAKRKRRSSHKRIPLPEATRPNQRWSMDFVSDRLVDGRWFRILTVVDQYTRECLCAYADRSQTGEKVVVQMQRLALLRGVPESITTNNGGEFAGKADGGLGV